MGSANFSGFFIAEILSGNKMCDHVNSVHSPSCRKRDVCLIPESCEFCGVACKAGTEKLKRHVKNLHKLTAGLSTYSCPCCWTRYDHLIQLRWHIMLEHEQGQQVMATPDDVQLESPQPWSSCGNVDPISDNGTLPPTKKIENELEKILQDGSYTCPSCPDLMGKMSLAKFCSHMIFHAQRPFNCSVCHIYWFGPKELEDNPFAKEPPSNGHLCSEATLVRMHFKPGEIWECEWCPGKFGEARERDLHEDTEHFNLKRELEMKHKCLSCNSAYRSYKEWVVHRALEHPEIAAISCLYCDHTTVIQTKEGIGKY